MEFREFENGILYLGDCQEVLEHVGSFDHVLTDPPYMYLNHKIEKEWDSEAIFTMIREKINPKKGGFLLFGRGDSFFEQNLLLKKLGFLHKEDCLLLKNKISSPVLSMLRNGEYFTIRGLENFKINPVRIPISDKENVSDWQICDWLRRISSSKTYRKDIINFLETGNIDYNKISVSRENVTQVKNTKRTEPEVNIAKSIIEGKRLSNVLNASRELLEEGSHPTIKPSKELGYLIKAISQEQDVILDPFLGSGSTAIACINTNRRFIGIEIDREYYNLSCTRIEKLENNLKSSLFYKEVI